MRLPTRLLIPATVMFAAFCAVAATEPASVGKPAPTFTLNDQNGKAVNLADYKGKIVVLEWVNKDCPFCLRHLKAKTMDTVAAKYKDKDVVVLGIDSTARHNTEDRKKTVADHNLSYPVLDDSAGAVGKQYDARTTPHLFIINKEGTLVYKGAIDNDPEGDKSTRTNYVTAALDELLANKPVSTPETKSYGCGVKY